jgi:hypothetical protein
MLLAHAVLSPLPGIMSPQAAKTDAQEQLQGTPSQPGGNGSNAQQPAVPGALTSHQGPGDAGASYSLITPLRIINQEVALPLGPLAAAQARQAAKRGSGGGAQPGAVPGGTAVPAAPPAAGGAAGSAGEQ